MRLDHQHVLIVEDEFFIALDLEDSVRDAGANVVGPAANVKDALALLDAETVTAAILDVNLGRELSLAVAQRLERDQIPFIYHSGQTTLLGSPAWPKATVVNKPAMPIALIAALAEAIKK